MPNKKNRIDFYKDLVCPDEVRSDYTPFEEWYHGSLSKAKVLEDRSFSILDYYSAFRKLYDYIVRNFAPEELKKVYCEFNEAKETMGITLAFMENTINMNKTFLKEIESEFSPDDDDDYDRLTVILTEKDNSVKMNFKRRCDLDENQTS